MPLVLEGEKQSILLRCHGFLVIITGVVAGRQLPPEI